MSASGTMLALLPRVAVALRSRFLRYCRRHAGGIVASHARDGVTGQVAGRHEPTSGRALSMCTSTRWFVPTAFAHQLESNLL